MLSLDQNPKVKFCWIVDDFLDTTGCWIFERKSCKKCGYTLLCKNLDKWSKYTIKDTKEGLKEKKMIFVFGYLLDTARCWVFNRHKACEKCGFNSRCEEFDKWYHRWLDIKEWV